MAETPETQAEVLANAMMQLGELIFGAWQQFNTLAQEYNSLNAAEIFQSMGTVSVNADGSLGAADSSPNPAHPINPAIYTILQRSVSANVLAELATFETEFGNLCNGAAVATQSNAPALLASLVGG